MTRFPCSLWFVLSAACVLSATCVLSTKVWAEPPQPQRPSDPPSIEKAPPADDPAEPDSAGTLEIPSILQQPLTPLPQPDADARRRFNEAVQRRIQQALENGDDTPTGDPILDGTLNAIRRQGSVLQDWPADQALFSTPASGASPPGNLQPGGLPAGGLHAGGTTDEAYYHTAEALLRSARLLSRLPGQDATRQQLIQQLRREAVRCLSDESGEPALYGSPPLITP